MPSHTNALNAILRFVASNVAISGTVSILGVLLTRFLGPADSGRLTLLTQMAFVAVPLLSLSLPDALAVVGPTLSASERNAAVVRVRFIVASTLALSTVACLICARRGWLPAEVREALAPFLLFAWAMGLGGVEGAALRSQGAFRSLTLLLLVRDVGGRVLALAALIVAARRSHGIVMWSLAVSSAATALLAYFRSKSSVAPSGPLPVPLRQFARRSMLGLTVYMALQSVDVAALRLTHDPAVVGTYAAGVKVPAILYSLLVSQLAVPLTFYFSTPEWSGRRVALTLRGSVLFTLAAGIGISTLAALADPIAAFLYGPAFESAALPMRIHAFSIMFTAATFFSYVLLTSQSVPHHTVPFSVLQLAITGGASALLIPRFHGAGAATSMLLGAAGLSFAMIAWMDRSHGLRFLRRLLGFTVAAAAALATSLGPARALTPVAFVVTSFACRAVTRDDVSWGLRLFNTKRGAAT